MFTRTHKMYPNRTHRQADLMEMWDRTKTTWNENNVPTAVCVLMEDMLTAMGDDAKLLTEDKP